MAVAPCFGFLDPVAAVLFPTIAGGSGQPTAGIRKDRDGPGHADPGHGGKEAHTRGFPESGDGADPLPLHRRAGTGMTAPELA